MFWVLSKVSWHALNTWRQHGRGIGCFLLQWKKIFCRTWDFLSWFIFYKTIPAWNYLTPELLAKVPKVRGAAWGPTAEQCKVRAAQPWAARHLPAASPQVLAVIYTPITINKDHSHWGVCYVKSFSLSLQPLEQVLYCTSKNFCLVPIVIFFPLVRKGAFLPPRNYLLLI